LEESDETLYEAQKEKEDGDNKKSTFAALNNRLRLKSDGWRRNAARIFVLFLILFRFSSMRT
jgi:hypothetical protein